ncbi:unnamed protein product [Prunus armeniaca]
MGCCQQVLSVGDVNHILMCWMPSGAVKPSSWGLSYQVVVLVSELVESRFCVCGECELSPGIRWSCGIFEHGTDLNFQLSERMTSGSGSLKDRVTRIEVYLRTPMSDDALSVAMRLEDLRVKMAEIQKSSEN